MNKDEVLINRVNESKLQTIKLEDYFPAQEICEFDLKEFLFQGLILKELDFRKALKDLDWSQFDHKYITVFCSTDAIIPTWAYMLVATFANGHALDVYFGNKEEFLRTYYRQIISKLNPEDYRDALLVIKGCSDKPVPASAYLDITHHLKPVAASIMFGEPCSTVPVYKRPKSS